MNKNFVNNVDIIYPELISSDGWLIKKPLLLKYINNEELGALPQISEKLTEKSSKIDLLYRLLFLECVEIEYTYRFYHYSFKTLMLYDYCNEIEFFLKFIISKNNLETSELYRELFSEKTFENEVQHINYYNKNWNKMKTLLANFNLAKTILWNVYLNSDSEFNLEESKMFWDIFNM